jgi:hypothetical protein
MHSLRERALAALVVLLAANAARAASNDFQAQVISLPVSGCPSRFADLDGDRRLDLLAVDPIDQKLLVYRQRASGFTNAPDQVIGLPPQTGWISMLDVDAHPGMELLLSGADGVAYHWQEGGSFESERRTLVKAGQVFTNDDSPVLISLATNAAIPVVSGTEAVLFQRNHAYEWSRSQPMALKPMPTRWRVETNEWSMGRNSARSLHILQSFGSKSGGREEEPSDKDIITKVLEEIMKKTESRRYLGTNRVDLNGDGRTDLVLWQKFGQMEPRTDVYVLLRDGDGRLPARPTQVLHCSGLPIPVGSTESHSLLGDLQGDGTYQLVLLELKSTFTSVSGALEMALSRGVEWALTIRRFSHGAFARNAETALTTTLVMSAEMDERWPLFVCGDYNGDGRLDFAVRRATHQWNIYFSANDGRWFAPQPAMTFETPLQGNFEIDDLNGDGRSDLVLRAPEDPRVFLFMTNPPQAKGQRP